MSEWLAQYGGTFSGGVIATMILVAFITGRVIPKATLATRTEAYEKEVARVNEAHAAEILRMTAGYEGEIKRTGDDRDDWRDTARAKDTVITEQGKQITELLEAARLTHAMVQALPSAAAGGGTHA